MISHIVRSQREPVENGFRRHREGNTAIQMNSISWFPHLIERSQTNVANTHSSSDISSSKMECSSTVLNDGHHQRVKLSYLAQLELYKTEKPYQIYQDIPPGEKQTNVVWSDGPAELMRDVRAEDWKTKYNLDTYGFQWYEHSSDLCRRDFDDEIMVNETYKPECKNFLQKVFPQARIIDIFDFKVNIDSQELSNTASS